MMSRSTASRIAAFALAWSCLMLPLLPRQATAELKGPTKVNVDRQQLEEACDNSGGIAWGTQAEGEYGCVTDDHLVICEGSGDCDAWTWEESKRATGMPTSLLVWGEPSEVAAPAQGSSCPACEAIVNEIESLDREREALARAYLRARNDARAARFATRSEALAAYERLETAARAVRANGDRRQVLEHELQTARAASYRRPVQLSQNDRDRLTAVRRELAGNVEQVAQIVAPGLELAEQGPIARAVIVSTPGGDITFGGGTLEVEWPDGDRFCYQDPPGVSCQGSCPCE